MTHRHVVIAGNGRSGTTFLVHLFTALGIDTGFTEESAQSSIDPLSNAGLEFNLFRPDYENLPYIIKSPFFYKVADEILNNPKIEIENILIPMRKLEDAAKSRIRIQSLAEEKAQKTIREGLVPGGITGTNDKAEQELVLARQINELIISVAESEVPYTFISFPLLVTNPHYLYKKIGFLIPEIKFDTFLEVFTKISKPELVHEF